VKDKADSMSNRIVVDFRLLVKWLYRLHSIILGVKIRSQRGIEGDGIPDLTKKQF